MTAYCTTRLAPGAGSAYSDCLKDNNETSLFCRCWSEQQAGRRRGTRLSQRDGVCQEFQLHDEHANSDPKLLECSDTRPGIDVDHTFFLAVFASLVFVAVVLTAFGRRCRLRVQPPHHYLDLSSRWSCLPCCRFLCTSTSVHSKGEDDAENDCDDETLESEDVLIPSRALKKAPDPTFVSSNRLLSPRREEDDDRDFETG